MSKILKAFLSLLLVFLLATAPGLVFAEEGKDTAGEALPVITCKEIVPRYTLAPNVIEFKDITKDFKINYNSKRMYPLDKTQKYEANQILLDLRDEIAYKISSVEADNKGQIYYAFTKPKLKEVFASFSIPEAAIKLTADNLVSISSEASGFKVSEKFSNANDNTVHTFSFDKVNGDEGIRTLDGYEETSSDFNLEGSIQLVNPRFEIYYDLDTDVYDVKFLVDEYLTANLEAFIEGNFLEPEEKELARYAIPIAGVGSLDFTLMLKYGGSGAANIEVTVNQSMTVSVGIQGELDWGIPCTAEAYFNYSNSMINAVGSAGGQASVYVGAVPCISLNVFGIEIGNVNAIAGANADVKLNAVKNNNEDMIKVNFDITAFIHADAEVLGYKQHIYKTSWVVLHKEWTRTLTELWDSFYNDVLAP